MSDEVVTKLTIDADTSGADAYSSAMDRAGEAADNILGKNGDLSLKIAGVSIGFVAAAAAIKQGIDYVVDFNKQLADMETVANRVGLSLKDFQALQFGGQIAGLSDNQINAGLEKSSMLLNDAQRNANSLSKLFDENGISIRNGNGQLLTQNQLLGVAADLVSKAANPRDATAIAQMLGFTKEWVPLLEQGSAAIAGLGDEATRAGAVIDDATIQKASEFDAHWRKSSVELSTYMRAALAGLMPYVDDLIQGAGNFIKGLDRGKIEAAVNGLLAASGIPASGGIRIDTGGFSKLIDDLNQNLEGKSIWSAEFWHALGQSFAGGAIEVFGPEQAKWYSGAGALAAGGTGFSDARSQFAQQAPWLSVGKQFSEFDGGLSKLSFGGATKVPGADQGKDSVDRAIDSLRKHTEQQLADAQAVGLGDAALARFRAEAAETAAVQANGGKETAAQAAAFAKLKDEAAAAADALARAKIEGQIDFNNKTMFLGQGDIAIAQQLKGLYGNDVAAALNSSYAAALRLNDAFKGLSSAIENQLVTGLTDITMGTKSFKDGASEMALGFAKAIDQMIIKILIVEPLLRQLQALVSASGILGFSGGTVPGAIGPTSVNGAPLVTSAHGNVFAAGSVVPFASGGIPDLVSSPTIAPMALFGEAGEEAIMPLRRGPDGRLGVSGAGGGSMPQVNVTLIESPNGGGQVSQRANSNGGMDIEIMVGKIAAKSAGTPGAPLNRMLTDGFGASQSLTRR